MSRLIGPDPERSVTLVRQSDAIGDPVLQTNEDSRFTRNVPDSDGREAAGLSIALV
jgi:hypothetical protein